MEKINIADYEDKILRPNYLFGETVSILKNDNKIIGETKILFPKDDYNMIDRGERVNSSMHILATWNLMHIIRDLQNYGRPYAKKVSIESFRPTVIETEMLLRAAIEIQEETEKKVSGVLMAEFYDEVSRLHARIECEFVARKEN